MSKRSIVLAVSLVLLSALGCGDDSSPPSSDAAPNDVTVDSPVSADGATESAVDAPAEAAAEGGDAGAEAAAEGGDAMSEVSVEAGDAQSADASDATSPGDASDGG